MLTKRNIQIFKCIVDEFIQNAEPVGSMMLKRKYDLPFSSATIRNDMMYLEEIGYLEKTHTSSGRIPSTLGYKFYCEHLLDNKLDDQVEFAITEIMKDKQLNLNEAIQQSCDILSKMTNLTSGALGPLAEKQRLEHIKLFPINDRSAVCVFICDSGHTENKNFLFDRKVSVEDIQRCCEILNDRLKGTLIEEVMDKLESLRPILAKNVERHEMLYHAFVKAFMKFASDNVYFSGKENMLYQPEFSDLEKLKELMRMIENKTIWQEISDNSQKLALKKKDGSKMIWLDDVAVVTNTFSINDEEGKLMVVGPARMDYDRIVGLLDYIALLIEKMYGSGGNHER